MRFATILLLAALVGCSFAGPRRTGLLARLSQPPPTLEVAERCLCVGMSGEDLGRLMGLRCPPFISLMVSHYPLDGGILSITHDQDGSVASWQIQRSQTP
jgi:hypothetical protein